MKTIVDLTQSGRQAGSQGELQNVYVLGSYDHDIEYRITVETLTTEDGDDTDRGALDLPVRSVAKIGLQYYFATDLRFVNYPASECVFPTSNELTLQTAKGFRGSISAQLVFDDFLIFRSRERPTRGEAVQELAGWAALQGDRWSFPSEVVEMIEKMEALKKREADVARREAIADEAEGGPA